MSLSQSSMNRSPRIRHESADPFAMQLALSRVHARLVPMQRGQHGYTVDPSAEGWVEPTTGRGFAGYGLSRALRMLLDVLRGLTALHDTFDADGVNFAHGEVTLSQFRVDGEGVCRLIPLTTRHSSATESTPPAHALGYLAPERLLGERLDARADVYSAGVLLWEALAGRRLFNEASADAIIERLMGERLPMPQLPPELAWAIPLKSIAARALSVDPYQRFADCAELATSIAIVARERVATHGEIAVLLGSKGRSLNSVAQQRPVPTRSSTFPSVSLPAAPVSVSAAPSSRNGFPLATTPVPRSLTPAPRSTSPAVRALTPVPRSVIPSAPVVSAGRPSQRNVPHKSPLATLIGTGEVVPASHRRKTLTSLGTPLAALDLVEASPASSGADPASTLPPSLPVWALSVPAVSSSSRQARTSSSAVVARATLESIPLAEELAKFRGSSSRRWLIALSLVALIAGVIALVAKSSEPPETGTKRGLTQSRPPAPGVAAGTLASEPRSTPADPTRLEPPSTGDSRNAVPPSNSKELRPSKPAASKPTSSTKDYGI